MSGVGGNAATLNVTFSYGGETTTLAVEVDETPVGQFDPGTLYLATPQDYAVRPINGETLYRFKTDVNSIEMGGFK